MNGNRPGKPVQNPPPTGMLLRSQASTVCKRLMRLQTCNARNEKGRPHGQSKFVHGAFPFIFYSGPVPCLNKSALLHKHCNGLFFSTGQYSLCTDHRIPAGSRRHRRIFRKVLCGRRVCRYTEFYLFHRLLLTYALSSSQNEVLSFDLLFSDDDFVNSAPSMPKTKSVSSFKHP